MTDYGQDVSTFVGTPGDLDPGMRWVNGPPAVAIRGARRLTSARGTLPYAPDDGLDLRDYLNKAVSAKDVFVLNQLCATELEKDDEIMSAQVNVSADLAAGTLSVAVNLELSDLPSFKFVLQISAVSVQILRAAA